MQRFKRRFIGLCLVPIFLAALDGSVTLHGQPSDYWAGNHSHVIEGTPIFRILLMHGPAAYIAGLAGWVLAFVGLILLMPQTLALAVCLGFTLGHAIGAYSWMTSSPYFFQLYYGTIIFAAVGLATGIRWGWRAEPQHDGPDGAHLPPGIRWACIVVCGGVLVYYLSPH